MDTARGHRQRVVRRREVIRWGSTAVATAGDLTVECDEALDGPEVWQVTVEAAALSFSLQVKNRKQLEKVRNFLTAPAKSGPPEVSIGRSLRLMRDDENASRWFLTAGVRGFHVRVIVAEDDARKLAEALSDVLDQWEG